MVTKYEETVMSADLSLAPCPFCGGNTAYVVDRDDGTVECVYCPSCFAEGPPLDYRFSGTHDEARRMAVDAWNKRYKET